MIRGEDDVLERTLAHNAEFVDCFYVLDGTDPATTSYRICSAHPKCVGYTLDRELPRKRYGDRPRDGWRQHLYEQAVAAHGFDHWFLLLHGDEVWTALPVNGDADGYNFPLPMYFPRVGEPWDYTKHPLDQLRWHLGPGYKEFRMFRGGEKVRYDETQHFNVTPSGLHNIGYFAAPIRHYLYRSPESQRERAQTSFDPDNYKHITDGDAVYWTDEMIEQARALGCYGELSHA
jgi:hypothetical protein